MLNLPNLITLARLLASPVVVYLVLDSSWLAAFCIFVAAGLSDAIDGFLARRLNARSLVGAYLDPLADKALLVGAFVVIGYMGQIPAWLVILVVFRDLLIIGGVLLVHTLTDKFEIRPLMISKLNTAVQFLLPTYVLGRLGFGLAEGWLGLALTVLAAATTVLSGGAYVWAWVRRIAEMEETD